MLEVQYGKSQYGNEHSSLPVHQVLSWNTSNENTNRADEQMCFHVQILRVFMAGVWLGIQHVHSFPFEPLYGVMVTDSLFASCFLIFVFALSAFVMGCEWVGGRSRN